MNRYVRRMQTGTPFVFCLMSMLGCSRLDPAIESRLSEIRSEAGCPDPARVKIVRLTKEANRAPCNLVGLVFKQIGESKGAEAGLHPSDTSLVQTVYVQFVFATEAGTKEQSFERWVLEMMVANRSVPIGVVIDAKSGEVTFAPGDATIRSTR